MRTSGAVSVERPPWFAHVVGSLEGAGTLISDHHLVTCAHLVIEPKGAYIGVQTVAEVDFPFLDTSDTKTIYRAHVQVLSPPNADDLALLEIDLGLGTEPAGAERLPAGCVVGWFMSPEAIQGHRYRVFGYPNTMGGWSYGKIGGPLTAGQVQLDRDASSGYPIVPGFSGSPIWDEDAQALVGLVVARERRPEEGIQVGFGVMTGVLRRHLGPVGIQLRRATPLSSRERKTSTQIPSSKKPQRPVANRDQDVASPSLMATLFSGDPVLSLPLADRILSPSEGLIKQVVGSIGGRHVTICALRIFLAHRPETSGPLMAKQILNAAKSWGRASQVPACLSPPLKASALELLLQGLESNEPDVVRKCVEGIGFLGALEYAFKVEDLIETYSSYYLQKYLSYVLVAVARLFVAAPDADEVERQFHFVQAAVNRLLATRQPLVEMYSMSNVIAKAPSTHADHFTKVWLHHSQVEIRRMGLQALGTMRLRRALPHIWPLVEDAGESDAVRYSAALAIANIGGNSAATRLADIYELERERTGRSPNGFDHAISKCLADIDDPDRFGQLAGDLHKRGQYRNWIYRAIGSAHMDQLEPIVRSGLTDADPLDRGQAALALARIAGTKAIEDLRTAYRESGALIERILTSLALILVGDTSRDPDYAQLRSDLAVEAYMYERLLRDDIVEVLSHQEDANAVLIVNCWKRIFSEVVDY